MFLRCFAYDVSLTAKRKNPPCNKHDGPKNHRRTYDTTATMKKKTPSAVDKSWRGEPRE